MKQHFKYKILAVFVITVTWQARAGHDAYRVETAGYLRTPMPTSAGIVCTDNFGSSMYLVREGVLTLLLTAPGVGQGMQVSPDGRNVGFKLIDDEGKQTPALLDVVTGSVSLLEVSRELAGQVSFTLDGSVGFTLGDTLVVRTSGGETRFDLGAYVNTAPLSPDARYVVYNDASDQLWLLSLSDDVRRKITDGKKGYCAPIWSPDATRICFAGLEGTLYLYHLRDDRMVTIGAGIRPAWSPDGRSLVFCRTETQEDDRVSSDLFVVACDGTGLRKLFSTPEVSEMDPVFTPDGADILYQTYERGEIVRRNVPGTGLLASAPAAVVARTPQGLIRANNLRLVATPALDVPYLNQVYDTPDWFNGHWACAPTQAMMVLAYYHILPPWNITCTWPAPHLTPWGRYVAERYRFRQVDYQSLAGDPNETMAAGGYGYMWTGSFSPHSRMATYYRNHGLAATQTEGTPFDVALAEIDSARPLSMCVLLTTSGHLVLAHGLGTHPRTLVFNDPYGNKNLGYMNYAGKDVQYDWPGYNNGYQNLNQVAWCIATAATPAAEGDTLIDDLQFEQGFYLHTAPPASMLSWRDINRGHRGHLWYASTQGSGTDTAYAVWTPRLPTDGLYDVDAFISISNATDAHYRVMTMYGEQPVTVNQKMYAEAWAPLGTFPFLRDTPSYVRLGDASSIAGQEIVFDAVRWKFRGPLTSTALQETPSGFGLSQNYPNPFNPSTRINFDVPEDAGVRLSVYDVLGREVAVLVSGRKPPGRYSVMFDASGLSGGVYLCRLVSGPHVLTRGMLLLK